MPFSPKLARFARRTLLTLAVLATLVVGFIVEENWRGERAWREYAARCAAAGDPVDVFPAPSTLPPERNFMKTPLLDRLLFAKEGSTELKEFEKTLSSPEVTSGAFQAWRTGWMTDLSAIAGTTASEGTDTPALQTDYFAGVDAVLVAHAQAGSAAILEELRQAVAGRAESQVVHRMAISETSLLDFPLPNFPLIRRLNNALALDACAALARGRDVQAWRDGMAMVQLARGFADTPDITLVETMVGTVLVNTVAQPTWEAEVRRSWTDSQWARFQQELAKVAPLNSLERCFRIERVHAAGLLQNTPVERLLSAEAQWDDPLPRWAVVLHVVSGWVQWNKISAVEDMNARLVVMAKRCTTEFLPSLQRDRARRLTGRGMATPHTLLAPGYVPGFEKVIDMVLVAENNVTLMRAVCALERYRLAHGGYPETLAELAPAYLDAVPLDVIDGQPLRYRRLADGTFKLYSVGLNGTDDDGALSDWKTDEGRRSGDWCWPQPAK